LSIYRNSFEANLHSALEYGKFNRENKRIKNMELD